MVQTGTCLCSSGPYHRPGILISYWVLWYCPCLHEVHIIASRNGPRPSPWCLGPPAGLGESMGLMYDISYTIYRIGHNWTSFGASIRSARELRTKLHRQIQCFFVPRLFVCFGSEHKQYVSVNVCFKKQAACGKIVQS